ncbi:hypothetical protein [Streptomyces sp. NPDC048710]|uniref:hypothetical protein n=1 Tax=Streptomyces sp. NPDC048710 TaxID=3365586 RepID=UPI003721985E
MIAEAQMKWLLTVPADTDIDALVRALAAIGAVVEDDKPVPIGDHDKVVYVEGPQDLPSRLAGTNVEVRGIDPNSELGFFAQTG